jgi:HD-like signal output (HDOD) protein
MGRFISPEILGYIKQAEEVEHIGRLEAESLLLNVHHGELGGLIARHWNLPPRVVLAITHHHHPSAGKDVVCDVTYLANQVAKVIEAGLRGEELTLSVEPEVMERLGLEEKSFGSFCRSAASRYQQVSLRYSAA